MNTSMRPARRSDDESPVRPIPRVTRPAMDTISGSRAKPVVVSPVDVAATNAPVVPVVSSQVNPVEAEKPPVLETREQSEERAPRPALQIDTHVDVPRTTEVPVSIAEEIDELPIVDEGNKWSKPAEDKKKRQRRRWGILVLLFMVTGVTGSLFLRSSSALQPSQVPVAQQEVASQTKEVPPAVAYDAPPANYLSSYKVGNMQARIITISTIGVEARMLSVGVDGRGQPQLPAQAYDTGWYNVSAKPGEAGTVVVSGMCTTEVGKGIFENLGKLNKGDEIAIERGDGVHFSYSVKEIYRSPVDTLDMTKVLSPFDPKAPGLSLITCDGAYESKTNDSTNRLVVRAVQI